MLLAHEGDHLQWNSHHLAHWYSHHHLPWYLHVHRGHHGAGSAGTYVGRVGMLAAALGVGAAVATGLCVVCASADTGNVNVTGDSSTSQSVNPGIARSTLASPAATVTRRGSEIHITMPDSMMAPADVAAAADDVTAADIASPPPASTPRAATAASLSKAMTVGQSSSAAAAETPPVRVRRSAAVASAATKSAATSTTTTSIESEQMTLSPSSSGRIVTDRSASGGSALAITGNATASATLTIPSSTTGLVIRAKVSAGAPNMTVAIDGEPVTTLLVTPTGYTDFTFAGALLAGVHLITVSSSSATSKNTLYLDKITTITGSIVDDFTGKSGSAPNDALWGVRSGSGFDGGIASYAAGNAVLDGQGHLVLQAVKTKTGYSSGWVWSKNDVSYGYGTITARILMPKGQGLAPAFWLMGADSDTVGWPGSGEIDVVEMPSTTTTLYSTLHGPISGSTDTQQAQIISSVPDLSAGYHNYWVTHLKDSITFGIDNQVLGTMTPNSLAPGETWVYNRPMYIMLNLSVGGGWAGAPNASTVFPAKMVIDSVRWDPAIAA